MKKDYFNPGYFDSQETQIVFDAAIIKKNLREVKMKVEVKQQMGTMTTERLGWFKVKMQTLKHTMRLFNTIPLVKFYKRYRYFKYPRGKAFQDVNYN